MSRDLGPQQVRLLAFADRYRGAPVALLPELLGLTDRRCRKVVQSLVEREMVLVVDDPDSGDRRVWTPTARALWARRQRWGQFVVEELKLPGVHGIACEACGHWMRTVGPCMRTGEPGAPAR